MKHDPALAAKLYAKPSHLEETLSLQLRAVGLHPEREHRFHPPRRWRFDFAFTDKKLAIEAEGGIFSRGRHVRGAGFAKDCEKYNAANLDGWRVLRFTADQIKSGQALAQIKAALAERGVEQHGTG